MMKKIGQLPYQEWLCDKEIKAVFEALDYKLLFVGGSVRDALLHKQVKDFDLATELLPQDVITRLTEKGIKVLPLGIKFGSVTAFLSDGKELEITTLREDVETDGRHAKVRFGTDFIADARRRDFTINALYADLEGFVYDPLGAFEDISAGVVRFIGNAKERIKEDALRILRFFRFQAYYGQTSPDLGAMAGIREFAPLIANLSKERITDEFYKIIMAEKAEDSLLLMQKLGVLDVINTNNKNIEAFGQLVWLETRGIVMEGIAPSLMRRLAILFDWKQKPVCNMLKLTKKQSLKLAELLKEDEIISFLKTKGIGQAIYKFGKENVKDAFLIHFARERGKQTRFSFSLDKEILSLLEKIIQTEEPKFPLQGKDLQKLGITEGLEIGKKLKELEQKWIKSDFSLKKGQLLED